MFEEEQTAWDWLSDMASLFFVAMLIIFITLLGGALYWVFS